MFMPIIPTVVYLMYRSFLHCLSMRIISICEILCLRITFFTFFCNLYFSSNITHLKTFSLTFHSILSGRCKFHSYTLHASKNKIENYKNTNCKFIVIGHRDDDNSIFVLCIIKKCTNIHKILCIKL